MFFDSRMIKRAREGVLLLQATRVYVATIRNYFYFFVFNFVCVWEREREFTKKGNSVEWIYQKRQALPSKVKTNNAEEHNKKPLNLEAAGSVPPCKVLARDYAASKGKWTASWVWDEIVNIIMVECHMPWAWWNCLNLKSSDYFELKNFKIITLLKGTYEEGAKNSKTAGFAIRPGIKYLCTKSIIQESTLHSKKILSKQQHKQNKKIMHYKINYLGSFAVGMTSYTIIIT